MFGYSEVLSAMKIGFWGALPGGLGVRMVVPQTVYEAGKVVIRLGETVDERGEHCIEAKVLMSKTEETVMQYIREKMGGRSSIGTDIAQNREWKCKGFLKDYYLWLGNQYIEQGKQLVPEPIPLPIIPPMPKPFPEPESESEERKYDPCDTLCQKLHGSDKSWYDVGGKAQLAGCKLVCYAFIAGGILLAVALAVMGRKGTTKVVIAGAETAKEGTKTAGAAVRKIK